MSCSTGLEDLMRAAIASQAGSPDSANEDWAGVLAPGLALVLDGLSAPDGIGTGCRHGTPWFVSQLGPRLLTLAAVAESQEAPMRARLARLAYSLAALAALGAANRWH
jgi:hypothetical protein